MSAFLPWHSPALHGLELLAAQEDWLIHLTDTLGNCLHHGIGCDAVRECLEQLMQGLERCLEEEEHAFAEMGLQMDALHRIAHSQLHLAIETMTERHARGEQVGEHLLQQLQDWLLEHCGQLHTESLHH